MDEEEIAVPKGWVVKYSQSKEPGRPYYVRLSDGHRQWDPPSDRNWEVIAAVVILAAVGLYPSSGDPGDSSAVLTHGGCTCAPYTYEGDRTLGAGCIPDAGGDNIGWCDVEPGCAAAKDITEDSDGWDTCTPAVFSDVEYEYADTAETGLDTGAVSQTQDGATTSLEATAENESVVWNEEDQADIDNVSEAATADESAIDGDASFIPSDGQGEDLPRRCSDMEPCPSLYDCQLDEDLDYSVCVHSATRQRDEENLLSMFQAKAGTPVQIQRLDTVVADAVRAKVKEDPKGVRAGAAPGSLKPGQVDQEALPAARGYPSSRPGGHGQAAGGRGSLHSGRPNGRPQSREQMQARAEAAARAREAAAAAEKERRAAEREAEIAAEQAAQAKFERQMSMVATIVRWFGAMLAWLVIFECSPSLHNGFYQLCVWLLCGARCFICFGTWLVASLQSRCGSSSSTQEAEQRAAAGAGNDNSSPVLSVVVVPAPGELLPWRVVCRRLIEQTREHDRTELIFVGTSNLDAWAGDVLDRMPRCRLQPQFVMYEPLATQFGNEIDEVEAFRAGAVHAKGECLLLVPSDVLLPAGYDWQVREALLTKSSLGSNSYAFAGVFRFGIYPRALSLRIQQEEQAIDRLEQRLAVAVGGTTTAGSIENGCRYDGQQHLDGLSDTRIALRAAATTAELVRYSAATSAALESELITRRQQFIRLVSEPMSSCSHPHVEPGQRALLPIGVVAVEVCARLCSWFFQCPRLEHGFFMRTADFLHLTDEMGIATPSNEVSSSTSAGRNRAGSASRSTHTCAVDEQRHSDDGRNAGPTHYVRAKNCRYHDLNQRLRHAAWRSSPLQGGSGGQSLRGCGRIVEVAPVQFDRGSDWHVQCAAFGCSARWEGEGDDHSGRVRLLLWQELTSQLAHCCACFTSAFWPGKLATADAE